ncbi:MAG: heparinase, partial [Armatimonadetes bacterium]|nr:heparinase [Armatimonadota bacterium]
MFGCGSALYLLFPCAVLAGEAHPVLPPRLEPARLPGLRRTIEPIMALGEAELLSVVPTQSAIFFTDCPNCTAGIQETQFASRSRQAHVPWELSRPTVMRCTWCGHEYPSAKYPMEQVLRVHNPRGEPQEYPYWADAKGYKHFFAARIDEHRIRFMEYAANQLARAYALSGEAAYARRCALILHRFAEVFPGYCYHSDYPFREKVIVAGPVDPQDFRSNYRTARWTWWAYKDIPARLIEAWDLTASSGELARLAPDAEAKVTAFFTSAVEQVLANPDDLTNMSPGMWTDIIAAGRILGRPEWVHEAVARIERFFDFGFFHDGAWSEGAPSYSQQVIGNLREVFATARGHSDPPGYRHPVTGRRFEALDLEQQLPGAARARQAYDLMRLPNGRLLPIHDTWSS